jgi:hypothetical protein
MDVRAPVTATNILATPAFCAAIRDGQMQAAEWEAQCLWPDILAEWGSHEAWQAECRRRRGADNDRRMARLIMTLMTDGAGRPRGTLRPPERARMLADRALAAFWVSVVGAGDEGFAEERRRIRDRQREATRATEPDERLAAIEGEAIKALLPTHRAWGLALVEAGAISDADILGAFVPPGEW